MKRIEKISRSAKTNIPIVLISTGLVFILLLLTMIISNGIIVFCVTSGFITARPGGTPLFPFLLQSGILSIFIGVILTLVLSHFPLRPVSRLINAIHAVAAGNLNVKIHIKHPKEFRELAECFNQMTDELAGIEMLRSDFINNFSHEFRTPIMSVQGFARLIKKGKLKDKDRDEYLDIIISECQRLADLSSRILDLSKIDSLTVLTDTEQYNAAEQIRGSILILQQKWEKKDICFDIKMEDSLITGNPALLKHVWVNLIDNAVKFSPHAGRISLHTARYPDRFIFQVSDEGIGMDMEMQGKIFDRFYQGDVSHSTEGCGLGLSLVKKIIELHRGTIHVESVPGKGSAFTVILPCRGTDAIPL